MTVSLIISTYNWPDALNLCFQSVLRQSRLPDEVIVADDGSKKETQQLVEEFAQTAPFPVKHIWHEDKGFRLAAIRNKAIVASSSDYIIQIDGDIILHPHFIKDHLSVARKGFFTKGSRVLLGETLSTEIMNGEMPKCIILQKDITKRANALRFPLLGKISAFMGNPKGFRHLCGCNMAFWRDDLIKVNGYNEDIYEWGGEDNEIAARLIHNGIYKQAIRWQMNAYHIFHPSNSKERLGLNNAILLKTVNEKKTRSENGLDKYI
ncbi:glycosyltransferase family 2 protein [Bacteroidales bacterium OttesenSCG-928-A17]|nr:glycosyltransferase family 2 protein [Bacteroidales bacterium OttesenSCG-928-A17]